MTRALRKRGARQVQTTRQLEPETTSYRDILWQRNPARVLKYRPQELHYYGWLPFLRLRNLQATVFSDVYLFVQMGILLCYVALLHSTGLGIRDRDLGAFVRMLGTSYSGALFNAAMVITFVLGLFTTLVINRWAGVRAAYGKVLSGTLDLSMTVCSVVHNEQDWTDIRAGRARVELRRLLNLAHVLVVTSADAQNDAFKKSAGVRTWVRQVASYLRREKGEGDEFLKGRGKDTSFLALEQEGLLNRDECELLKAGEKAGMASYQTVYYWVQMMLHKCNSAEFIIHQQQMLPMLLNQLNCIVESGSQVISSANAQMPYPYVHLVSFVVHFYLFLCATWFGCFLHVGYPTGKRMMQGNMLDNSWTSCWCYVLVMLAVILFQGLLNMHSLLDNPFGSHCAMFPLKKHISEVLNSTRTMLNDSDNLPMAFGDIFRLPNSEAGSPTSQESTSNHGMFPQTSAREAFLSPQLPSVLSLHRDSITTIFGARTSQREAEDVDSLSSDNVDSDAVRDIDNRDDDTDGPTTVNNSMSWTVDMAQE